MMTYIKGRRWLIFALITTLSWGLWGALIEFPEKNGFPATLGYCVWSVMMIPFSVAALGINKWKLDVSWKSILWGCGVGFLGAGGQLFLFNAVKEGPAYIIFPVVSLYPVVTVLLSVSILKERARLISWLGVALAIVAIVLLSYQEPGNKVTEGYLWLILAIGVFVMWGVQGFAMKFANNSIAAESIFFYMTITALLLAPVALLMTDFSQQINWSFKGPVATAMIQTLNALGALCLVYAVRYGKSIIVVPITAMAPVITIILSLIIYRVFPHWIVLAGMGLAVTAIFLLSRE
jgi:drug/metabolite transporter (DMT)-like permease